MRKLKNYTPTRFMAPDSHYDKAAADYAVAFVESLCHTKGKWAEKPFELIDWQERIVRDLFGILKPNGYRQFNTAYVEIPKKAGKELALDTPIPTPDGWKQMGELRIGDQVFDENGKPCTVVALSEIDDTEQCYRITFRDGSYIDAGENHLWDVEYTIGRTRPKQWATGEMYQKITQYRERHRGDTNEFRSLVRIPLAKPLRLPEGDLPVDYAVRFSTYDDQRISRRERKNSRRRVANIKRRAGFHYIKDIMPIDHPVKMRCIQVDSASHQYLAGPSMVPTHNSELAAAIALLLTCGDGEQRAEVYGCAADRNQASIVFNVAADMVRYCPALAKRVKILDSQKRLIYQPAGGVYQVLSSEISSKHGYNTSGVVFDELHTQPNRKLYDVMLRGSGDARMQPLYFLITTAGDNQNSICWEVHSKAKDLLEGRKHDPTFYPVIYGADEGDDWSDPEVWKKANPSLGVTFGIDKVQDAFNSAKENPGEENAFRQLRLNQWVKQSIRWMPMDKWDACALPVDPSSLEGRVCYAGLDLSSTTDITAFVLVFPPEDGCAMHGEDKYVVLPYFWVPEDNIPLRVRRDHVMYDLWERQGYLNTTEGNVIHYSFIEQFIDELGQKYNIREIAFDRWGATQMTQDLDGMGFSVVQFGQGFRDMSPPTKELMKLVLEKRLAHGGHPVLRWMMDNIFIKKDPAGNIKPDKEKSTEKIDGAVAMIMALDRAIRCGGDTGTSVYNDRGLLIL